MAKTIAIISCLDTKGKEAAFVKRVIEELGHRVLLIDVGVYSEPLIVPDITREEVAAAAGVTWKLTKGKEKAELLRIMIKGVQALVKTLYERGEFDGIFSMGGAANTTLGTSAMKVLPLGVPKVMVSTMANGRRVFEPWVGTKDIVLFHSVADVSGINLITEAILRNACAAVTGMAENAGRPLKPKELVIGTTMLGVTNAGVTQAVNILEAKGYEVVTFHANGVGGRAMEELIEKGLIGAVMDLTLHEIASELFGGYCEGAVNRLQAAGKAGIPQVIAPGAADVVDFAETDLPADWRSRKYIYQQPTILHLKLHPAEMVRIAEVIAGRLNESRGPVSVLLPLGGFCRDAVPGGSLWDPPTDRIFMNTLRENLDSKIKVTEVLANINDPVFSEAAVNALLELLERA